MKSNKLLNIVFVISLLMLSLISGMFFGRLKAEAHGDLCNGLTLENCENYGSTSCPAASGWTRSGNAIAGYNGPWYLRITDSSW